MAGWFELSKSTNDQFRFVLKAGNGEVILTSELYTTKFFFNLKAGNHQIIGTSQMYASAQSRDVGIASVKTNGSSKTIKEQI